jgi:hypothetical protein
MLTPGFRKYWKTTIFASLKPAMIDVLVDKAKKNLSNFGAVVFLAHLGEYMKRGDPSTTA